MNPKHSRVLLLRCAALCEFARAHDEFTSAQLMAATGLSPDSARKLIMTMRDSERIHVCRLEPDKMGRQRVHVYRFGAGEDVAGALGKRSPAAEDVPSADVVLEAARKLVPNSIFSVAS